MKKYGWAVFALTVVVILVGCGKENYPVVDENAKLIFFFGNTCPHCKLVEDFFEANNMDDKIDFEQAEIYTVKANAEIIKKKAELCGLDLENLGVPTLWNDGQCLVGDKDIIQFFKDKTNESK